MSQSFHAQDPALIAQQPLQTQSYLAAEAIEWMVVCFAHDSQLFSEARTLIAPHHFNPHEAPLRLVYEAMCLSVDRYGGLTYETIADAAVCMLTQNQSIALTELQQQIIFRRDGQGLIWNVCNPGVDVNEVNKSFARTLLQRFAYERTVVNPLRRVMNPGFNQGVPENLEQFLTTISNQNARISTLNVIPEFNLTPDIGTPMQPAYQYKKTGLAFIDEVLGGQRVGDCNGIIGPTGGGKTTLATHMATAGAKQCWVDAQISGGTPEIVVFFTVEESAIKLTPRIWSAFFQIPREKCENLGDWSTLTQPGQLDRYEAQMQAEQEYKLSETERYQLYSPQLRQCLKLVDVSGSEDYPDAGNGFIAELVSYLARYTAPIRSVFIDYAGLLCERHMQAQGMDESHYRYLLKTFGDRCRKDIGERFQCTVWVLHQLKGDMGKSSPIKLMHHSDASESKDFATNMAVCGCLGTACPQTGCRRMNWSKVRYRPNEKIPPSTLRINDRFAVMEDVTKIFAVDESGRQFLTQEDQRQIRGTSDLQRRQQPGPAGLRDTSNPLPNSLDIQI